MTDKRFIKVKATECNSQGHAGQRPKQVDLHINCDLVGAISGKKILLKQGLILSLSDKHFKDLIIDDTI